MQNPKMIVLGLLAKGMKYGLEMEAFIEKTNMRLWAQIGGSTIYKTLGDLKREGCVKVRLVPAKRGPGKKEFVLTELGWHSLTECVQIAMQSQASVYSDRVAGLVFAVTLPNGKAQETIRSTITGLDGALAMIEAEKTVHEGHPMAQIMLNFYGKIYTAEQEAMREALSGIVHK